MVETSLADSWGGVALLFVLFCGFLGGALGYGAWWRRRWLAGDSLLVRLGDSFLLASLVLFAAAFLLASARQLGFVPRWMWILAFLPGLYALRPTLVEALRSAGGRRVFAALVLLVFAVRALTAAVPSQHGDPLLYHLLGPRLWREAGGFEMHPNLPNALLASSWEVLYLWPQMFWFSTKPLFGLVEAQLFSQWMHLFLAWAGSALLVMRVFEWELKAKWLPLTGLAALFVAGVQWTAALAKNDAGIAFWSLGTIVLFADGFRRARWRCFLLSGVFAGLAVSGKITALLSLAPILGVLLLAERPWRRWGLTLAGGGSWVAGFLAGATPIYARNWILSGNPFFPLFPKVFPSPFLSRSWEAHFAQVHPSSPLDSLPRLWLRLPELAKENPFTIVGLLFLLLVGLRFLLKREAPEASKIVALMVGAVASYGIFVVTQAPEIELRYLGASLELLAAGGVFAALRWGAKLPTGKLQAGAAMLVAVVLLATSKLPLHVLRRAWAEPLGVHYLRSHSAGEAKAWLRQHAGNVFTVVAGDNEMYYLTPIQAAVVTERPDLDLATHEARDLAAFVAAVCERTQAAYLLDARPTGPHGVEARFGSAMLEPAKVFSAQGAHVYALHRLNERCASIPQ